jgi:hypothetical protein
MGVLADELVELIAGSATWPLASEMNVRAAIRLWKAFRENDRDVLKAEAGWTNQAERYMVDPLPERLSGAFGGLLFGSQPTVKTSDRADQERMDEGLRLMRWGSRLRVAEERNSSEGEIYWRLVCDPDRFEAPTLTWHSRLDVVPHFLAQQLRAVAFVNTLNEVTDDDKGIIWRHFEVHDDTTVRNVLFRGDSGSIGDEVDLTARREVQGLDPEWDHDVGMLAGRIVNIEGDDPTVGRSDYDGIEDFFLELNECFTTGRKNRGLTAMQRAYGPRSATDETGRLPEGQNFLATDETDATWGDGGAGTKFGVLEFRFDAEALITWSRNVAATALSRRGITPQFTGDATDAEGYAQSGTALRMRMIPSTVERERRIGPWDDELDTILLRWQQLDALSTEQGGFGTTWSAAADPPAVTLGDPLPVDEVEDSTRLASLRAANVISIEQAVRERRPDWDDDQVDEEVARIQADQQATGATPPGAGLTGGQGDTAPADLPDTGSVDLGGGVSVTADAAGFEVAGLAGPDAPAGGAAG